MILDTAILISLQSETILLQKISDSRKFFTIGHFSLQPVFKNKRKIIIKIKNVLLKIYILKLQKTIH